MDNFKQQSNIKFFSATGKV